MVLDLKSAGLLCHLGCQHRHFHPTGVPWFSRFWHQWVRVVSFCQSKPQKNMASLGRDHLSLEDGVSAVAENNYQSCCVLEVSQNSHWWRFCIYTLTKKIFLDCWSIQLDGDNFVVFVPCPSQNQYDMTAAKMLCDFSGRVSLLKISGGILL